MVDAVILSTARTGIGKAWKGAFNLTYGATLGAHSVRAAIERAGVEAAQIEDIYYGVSLNEGTTGSNVARQISLRAGLPVTTAGTTVTRFCASGLQAIASAAHYIRAENIDLMVSGGMEMISHVQNELNQHMRQDPWLREHKPEIYMNMLDTAEVVSRRYGISREDQDRYGARSHQRTAAAQAAGVFADEIVPMTVTMAVPGADGGFKRVEHTIDSDEGVRADTTFESASALRPVRPGGFTTAGNASQLSDGSSACVLASSAYAERHGLNPLGIVRGYAIAGCEPDEMGIGPVAAVPKLLARAGLTVEDIGLWELNEAFASQVLYCQRRLGIPDEILNVNGGAIAVGHPYGMSGSRMVGHALLEGRRRKIKYAVATMCIGGGHGAAMLLEVCN